MLSTALLFAYLNGKVLRRNEEKTIQALLKEWPKGAYTSLTVENFTTVLDWPLHVRRLNQSVHLLASREPSVYPRLKRLGINQKKMELEYSKNLLDAISDVKESVSIPPGAITNQSVVLLITDSTEENQNQFCNVYTYVIHKDGKPGTQTVKVWIQGKGRETPEVKFSKWVTDRVPLELSKPSDCQEVILQNASGGLLEGLTSNFFLIKDNTNDVELQTAPLDSGILAGTFRNILLETVRDAFPEVNIKESCPVLQDVSTWKEAFISNSVTGIRPISEIVFPDAKQSVKFETVPGKYTSQFIEATNSHHHRTPTSELV